ncbi:nitroreductase/quinone reductase family protein [Streptomyces sp. NPDC018031]|uniref:nitroreductase/quinone reductase family protein n=1 Tax=Streptomyces sp. NPDC018031 TaxID=3365033 RepID=UPI0037A2FDFA
MAQHTAHHMKSSRLENALVHRPIAWLVRRGITLNGKSELAVRGRASGEWRTVPVNPLTLDGRRYLVAPRGATQWVRNLRVAGGGELRVGRRTEEFTAVEITDEEKPAVLRAYLERWGREVGRFFDGVDAAAPPSELRRIAPRHPVFLLTSAR